MNSYFFCVTQPFNAGDLLINRLLVEELSTYGKVFVDCYNCPDDFRTILLGDSENIIDIYKDYGFSLKKGNIVSFVKCLKQNSISLYTQSPGPLNKPTQKKILLSYALIRNILSFLNIPFIRIGCCCSTALIRKTNVIENNKVQYYVRSKKGVDFLKQYRNIGIYYIPDLAYLYKYKIKTSLKRKTAVFSFREVTEGYGLFIQWLKDCIKVLHSNNYEVVFYYQVKSDRDFMHTLFCELKTENVILRDDIVWYDDFDFYSDKSIVISNRLHCLLMGSVYNAVPFAYVDNNILVRKIADVLESSMGEDASLFISDVYDKTKLQGIIDNILNNQRLIDNIVDKNANLCRNTIKGIVESLT